jgi:hypothetical protein
MAMRNRARKIHGAVDCTLLLTLPGYWVQFHRATSVEFLDPLYQDKEQLNVERPTVGRAPSRKRGFAREKTRAGLSSCAVRLSTGLGIDREGIGSRPIEAPQHLPGQHLPRFAQCAGLACIGPMQDARFSLGVYLTRSAATWPRRFRAATSVTARFKRNGDKETAVSELKQEQVAQEPLELIDCGPASEKTKGVAFYFLLEVGPPPFHKLFVW